MSLPYLPEPAHVLKSRGKSSPVNRHGTEIQHRSLFRSFSPLLLVLICILAGLFSAPRVAAAPSVPDLSPGFEANPSFEHLGPAQGLSSPVVHTVLQDRHGFLWFGTEDGLNRYDGNGFTVFRSDPDDPHSLSDDAVVHLFEDRRGFMWVSTRTGGLSRYDPATERFKRFRHDPRKTDGITGDYLSHGAGCEDASGNLWIGTQGSGLIRMDPETGRFTAYRHDPDNDNSLSHDVVNAILPMADGTLWIGTQSSLNRFDTRTGSFTHFHHDPNRDDSLGHDTVWSLTRRAGSGGEIWVGTAGGLSLFDPSSGRFENHAHDPDAPDSLGGTGVYAVAEAGADTLWIGTVNGGINRFFPETGRFLRSPFDPGNPRGIGSDVVRALYRDRSGILWAATWGGGVDKLNPFTQPLRIVDNAAFGGKDVFTLLGEPDSGRIWIGTLGGGLLRYDQSNGAGKTTRYRYTPADPRSIGGNKISSLYRDLKNRLWIGTFDGGLNRLDAGSDRFIRFHHEPGNDMSLSGISVRCIGGDPKGNLWIGTTHAGLYRYDPDTARVTRFRHDPADPSSIGGDKIWTLLVDGSGVLWVGTDRGLNRFREESGDFSRYQTGGVLDQTPSGNLVINLFEDSRGALWVATTAGLSRMAPDRSGFEHFTTRQGLSHNRVNSMLEDKAGRIWLGTSKGLNRYNPANGKISTFAEHPIAEGMFRHPAALRTRSGELMFGTRDGLLTFSLREFDGDLMPPPLAFTNLDIFGRTVSIGKNGPLESHINLTDRVELSRADSVIAIGFAALSYGAPRLNRYAFRLDGLDKNWNFRDAGHHFAQYTNLEPGNYVFRVKASNGNGIWNETGRSLVLTVLPLWWKSFWFRMTASLFFLASLGALYRLRVREIRKQRLALKRQVKARTRELHQSEARFRLLSEAAFEGICIIEKGIILDANPALYKMFGFQSLEEITGTRVEKLCAEEFKERVRKNIAGGREEPYEIEGLKRDGTRINLEIRGRSMVIDNRNLRFTVLQDITKQKRSAREREKMESRLRHAHKMEAMGTMAGGFAHNFNNILAAVLGYAELAKKQLPETSKAHRSIERVLISGRRAKDLVSQILTFSHLEVSRKELFKPHIPLLEAVNSIRESLSGNITLDTRIPEDSPVIKFDPAQFKTVIENICANALDAMADGNGVLGISLETVELSDGQHLRESDLLPGIFVGITVSDTGRGIPAEVMPRLFDPFFTTGDISEKDGIGLSVAHAMVQNNGGMIKVESEAGKGSAFHIFLPLARKGVGA